MQEENCFLAVLKAVESKSEGLAASEGPLVCHSMMDGEMKAGEGVNSPFIWSIVITSLLS